MKKRISKILAVLLAVCMLPIPFAALPASAAVAVDYDDADDGELLYTVDFSGDSVFESPGSSWAGATVDTTQTSVTMYTKSDSKRMSRGSAWGADLKGYTVLGKAYTTVFTLTASDSDEEIGFLPCDWAGFVIAPGQNKYKFVTTKHSTEDQGRYEGEITSGTYNGTGALTQTYAVEFKVSGTEANPSVDAYNLYVKSDDTWMLVCALTDEQMDESYFDWFYYYSGVYEEDFTMRFYRRYYKLDSSGFTTSTQDLTQQGTVTVSDAKVYKGLAIPQGDEVVEPIYNVNFNGNDGVFSDIDVMYDGMDVRTVTDEGRTIELATDVIPSKKGAVWSGQMYGNDAMLGKSYTVVFTVDAPDNQSVGVFFKYKDGFFVNPMNNTYSVGHCGNDGADVEKYVATTEYNGSGAAKQTYAVEFASGNVADSDEKYNCSAYRLWVQNNGKWNCIAELSADVRKEIAWNETDYEFMIQLARVSDGSTNKGSVTVSNMDVYSGLVASQFDKSQSSKIYYQLTKDNSNLRIIGVVDFTEEELKNYANLGFNVTMSFDGKDYKRTFTTQTVYTSLIADGKTINASDYGNYFFAVEITDLEFAAADDVVFQVEGFATKLDETIENVLGSKKIKIDGDPLSILPAFEGYSKTDTDTGDDCYMRSFGEVNYSDFEDYCDEIAESGFELYAEKTLEDNVYKTYVNKRYVVTTIYTAYNSYGKVLVEPRVGTALPTKAEDNVYNPIAGVDTTITQVGLYYGSLADTYNGMSYVVQLNDGSFIVVDGGFAYDGYADRLYSVLKKQAPDPDNIVIAAWMISHAHDDHVDIFESFFETYGDKITVERFICNLPSAEQVVNIWEAEWNRSDIVRGLLEKYFPNVPVTKAHPGQEFNIRNAKITVLYTWDVLDTDNSTSYKDFNNSSVVFKLEAEGKSMLFLGDYDDKGVTISNLYTSSTLNSDIVQVAHHGLPENSSGALYQLITPEYVFWPAAAWVVKNGTINLKNGSQNEWIIENCDEENIYLAEDNVYVFNMKDRTCVKYDTVSEYLSSAN